MEFLIVFVVFLIFVAPLLIASKRGLTKKQRFIIFVLSVFPPFYILALALSLFINEDFSFKKIEIFFNKAKEINNDKNLSSKEKQEILLREIKEFINPAFFKFLLGHYVNHKRITKVDYYNSKSDDSYSKYEDFDESTSAVERPKTSSNVLLIIFIILVIIGVYFICFK